MCGVPYHSADGYITKLISRGHHVAICEQVEDPSTAKGIVKREIIRVITPGTVMEGQFLEDRRNNYLACAANCDDGYSLAVTDITTGTFIVSSITGSKAASELSDELNRLMPAELVVPLSEVKTFLDILNLRGKFLVSGYKDEAFCLVEAGRALEKQFGPGAFFKTNFPAAELTVPAAGALMSFLKDTQKRNMAHINRVQFYLPGRFMNLDAATRRNLELTRSISENAKKFTLLSVLDHTVTSMGGRMLRTWIEQPLLRQEDIISRLGSVDELVNKALFRRELREELKNIYDLERLAGKISYGSANARDLVALKKSMLYLPAIKGLLSRADSALLKKISNDIDTMEETRELLSRAITDDPPLSLRDGGIIKTGFNPDVDKLRSAGSDARSMMAGLEERERRRTGIKSLKVGFNKVFGYYIEITRSNLNLAPEDYIRRQTLANAERYITPELKEYEDLVLGAQERLLHLEYKLFNEIREQLTVQIQRIQNSAEAVAGADVLHSLAEAASYNNYNKPEIINDGRLIIRDGRHPVLEKVMGPGNFVPNDTDMDCTENRLQLITGPNMAGKSTFMRQVALIVLMAQIGSFVPAAEARISLVDRIFTRIGASDDIAGGQSTFMVEMNECRAIVSGATENSLIVLDEVGRGTSTYDGISIARALAEYIHQRIKAKTLFSTHYLELTDLDRVPGIVNLNVAVKDEGEQIVFLRKVIPGRADRSYGIHVAKLAGLPAEIIGRSTEILRILEKGDKTLSKDVLTVDKGNNLKRNQENEIINELRHMDILSMTPLEAMNKLHLMQKKIDGGIVQ
jgi:DNA mismatch repair protein MutS